MGSVGRKAIGEPALVVAVEGMEGEELGDGLREGIGRTRRDRRERRDRSGLEGTDRW